MSRNPDGSVQSIDLELWIKMLDSMANVISASTSLIHLMYRGMETPRDIPRQIHTGKPVLWSRHRQSEFLRMYPKYFESAYGTVRRNSSYNSISNVQNYLEEQYYRSKEAIDRQYRSHNNINTLFSRSNVMNETCPEGLSRISNMVTKSSPNVPSIEGFPWN